MNRNTEIIIVIFACLLLSIILPTVGFGATDDTNTVSLLHFNGDFTDSASLTRTWTTGTTSTIDSSIKKFGSGSGYFTGGEYRQSTDAVFAPGTATFTVDFWVYFIPNALYSQYLCGNSNANASQGWDISTTYDGKIQVRGLNGGYVQSIVSSTTLSASIWYHIELDAGATTCYLFVNGVSAGTCARSSISASGNNFRIGYQATLYPFGSNFYGDMDEFRFSAGVLRHTTSFTPQTSEYEIPARGGRIYFGKI